MHRVIVTAGFAIGDRIDLPDDESHHLKVRRAEPEEPVVVLDGRGHVGTGRLQATGKRWVAMIDAVRTEPAPAPTRLLVGAGDRDRFGWLVEKAVETLVTDIVPIETERTRDVSSRIRPSHLEKLERRAAEALKQAGGAWLPTIHPVLGLDRAVEMFGGGVRWIADAGGARAPALRAADQVTVAIGPEGGFADGERSRLLAGGFDPVAFGDRTLRFETAALVAAVVVGLRRKDADE